MINLDAPITGNDSECPRCGKPAALCICADIQPIDNRIALLILQHPQEQDRELGTARLTVLHLKRAVMKTGLSWPSLAKALGREVNPKRWAVLYLGAATAATLPKDRELTLLDSKGRPLPEQEDALSEIDGVIVLDGSWSQAKTLWWRNPWVLKCRRLALNPKQPSRYGKLRREPRREGLSTLEAAALTVARLGGQPEIESALGLSFARLLSAYRLISTRTK
ncbi:MAG TPA: tRNA-uridine aminocarboxypropyltransferase [Stellaceae bacterium]|jgi:DTW domain-containing protein YfiP|nr:tRNA-uridine aminocarboxypropyltransferase [Stellaceae bacterium]